MLCNINVNLLLNSNRSNCLHSVLSSPYRATARSIASHWMWVFGTNSVSCPPNALSRRLSLPSSSLASPHWLSPTKLPCSKPPASTSLWVLILPQRRQIPHESHENLVSHCLCRFSESALATHPTRTPWPSLMVWLWTAHKCTMLGSDPLQTWCSPLPASCFHCKWTMQRRGCLAPSACYVEVK